MKKSKLKSLIKEVLKVINEDHGLGYGHNVSFDDYKKERDPLNDPELTGKINEGQYRFKDYGWLANMSGFRKPTDVYFGAIYLGVIESEPDGYVILVVMGPKGVVNIKKSPKNKFKTKDDAAKILHRTWKSFRQSEET